MKVWVILYELDHALYADATKVFSSPESAQRVFDEETRVFKECCRKGNEARALGAKLSRMGPLDHEESYNLALRQLGYTRNEVSSLQPYPDEIVEREVLS